MIGMVSFPGERDFSGQALSDAPDEPAHPFAGFSGPHPEL
jgi:hypothetical protein